MSLLEESQSLTDNKNALRDVLRGDLELTSALMQTEGKSKKRAPAVNNENAVTQPSNRYMRFQEEEPIDSVDLLVEQILQIFQVSGSNSKLEQQ